MPATRDTFIIITSFNVVTGFCSVASDGGKSSRGVLMKTQIYGWRDLFNCDFSFAFRWGALLPHHKFVSDCIVGRFASFLCVFLMINSLR